jgi:hypothetical protein
MSTRKSFLASSAALAALVPAAAPANPSPSPSPTAKASPEPTMAMAPLHFDLAAFDAALATTAAHRHLFTSVKIDGGEVLGAMRGTLKAYAEMGTPTKDVHPVAVLYHGAAIALAFDDTAWNEFFLPLLAKADPDPKRKAVRDDFATVVSPAKKGNPCLHAAGGEWDSSIESLVADANAHFFLCNNATHGFASMIAGRLGKSPAAVYAALVAHLVPNAMLVPAGVWAVHAVQERRYTLLATSL